MRGDLLQKLAGILIVLALSMAACTTSNNGEWKPLNPGASFEPRHCGADGPDTFYFPTGTFEDGHDGDAFSRQWYSSALTRMGEPSLSCGDALAEETYRFLWLRSFHQPVAVRIWRNGDTYELRAVTLDGAGGYKSGPIDRLIRKRLTKAGWDRATSALNAIQYWSMTGKATETEAEAEVVVDGAQWIIEGRKDRYHAVDRWGGDEGVGSAGLVFLELAGLQSIKPVY